VSVHRLQAIQALFPDSVATAVWDDGAEVPPLYTVERQAVARSVEKRRTEFAKGRVCARQALRQLGVAAAPIPVGPGRAPIWPDGIVGSITHCDGLVAAVVAYSDHESALGLDCEVAGALPSDLIGMVCTAKELRQIREAGQDGFGDWHTMIFSAKESIHKAIYGVGGDWLDFWDVDLTIDFRRKRFAASPSAKLGRDLPTLALVRGRFECLSDFILTGVVLRGEVPAPGKP